MCTHDGSSSPGGHEYGSTAGMWNGGDVVKGGSPMPFSAAGVMGIIKTTYKIKGNIF